MPKTTTSRISFQIKGKKSLDSNGTLAAKQNGTMGIKKQETQGFARRSLDMITGILKSNAEKPAINGFNGTSKKNSLLSRIAPKFGTARRSNNDNAELDSIPLPPTEEPAKSAKAKPSTKPERTESSLQNKNEVKYSVMKLNYDDEEMEELKPATPPRPQVESTKKSKKSLDSVKRDDNKLSKSKLEEDERIEDDKPSVDKRTKNESTKGSDNSAESRSVNKYDKKASKSKLEEDELIEDEKPSADKRTKNEPKSKLEKDKHIEGKKPSVNKRTKNESTKDSQKSAETRREIKYDDKASKSKSEKNGNIEDRKPSVDKSEKVAPSRKSQKHAENSTKNKIVSKYPVVKLKYDDEEMEELKPATPPSAKVESTKKSQKSSKIHAMRKGDGKSTKSRKDKGNRLEDEKSSEYQSTKAESTQKPKYFAEIRRSVIKYEDNLSKSKLEVDEHVEDEKPSADKSTENKSKSKLEENKHIEGKKPSVDKRTKNESTKESKKSAEIRPVIKYDIKSLKSKSEKNEHIEDKKPSVDKDETARSVKSIITKRLDNYKKDKDSVEAKVKSTCRSEPSTSSASRKDKMLSLESPRDSPYTTPIHERIFKKPFRGNNTSLNSTFNSQGYSPSPFFGRFKRAPRIETEEKGKFITCFFTKAYVFSNHFARPGLFEVDGTKYMCVEQFYMRYKAKVFGDYQTEKAVMAASNSSEMKKLGNQIENFDQLKWRRVAIQVMVIACLRKFEQNDDLREELFATAGSLLVEASPFDKFWGVGLSMESEMISKPNKWPGQNVLGRLLTMLRERLMSREGISESPREKPRIEKFNYYND
ncbi:N-glycosidase [Ditylenchus destructor]|uniref:N-glycosidase n=1 Tax=Ditylenchus destructor TaxID=166010 RepID=A0AAD4N4Q1_9BILA|nr:N-glycosidase [Ditylenchus destructor]